MQYRNDLWNSAVCKSRRRLLSNVVARRYWFWAAAIIVSIASIVHGYPDTLADSFLSSPRVHLSHTHARYFYFQEEIWRGLLIYVYSLFLSLFLCIEIYIDYSKPKFRHNYWSIIGDRQAPISASNCVCPRISEKLVLFPLRVSRWCGWRIFKSDDRPRELVWE